MLKKVPIIGVGGWSEVRARTGDSRVKTERMEL